ncbi:response regulator [Pseudobacteriovorax antillogorgiicola]|uniref:Response regulator receiver domain-containing protein n=1 Tax=Pseudobacteriovorax antillogorgiicola TaxID=1513793 RepID=A0A1Y6BPJ7_9BACT|nr:response regulator [Pseudobacteriovorax antillogorgiicola]TCS53758.1 response regulator receiver domain-containing protein [Pseudobacteriovorax antillogorgiicola]SMF22533.1 Response regulator receiver domain-containing protein [Pseudobacteriovorax antillogorgiicola]
MNVLLVDDDPDLIESIQDLLSETSIELSPMVSGARAMEYLRDHPYDVVICDINMPSVSGYEVMAAARELGCQHVIAISGDSLEWESKSRGATDFIRKPVDYDELLKALKTCL